MRNRIRQTDAPRSRCSGRQRSVPGRYAATPDNKTDPPLDGVVTAVGGGPLLIANGQAVADPNAPAPEEAGLRFPVAGIATEADGTLLLIAVDGRLPRFSIGLTRAELGALMLALGARDGMATDSGGSATLVARVLGERLPRVLNTPSDGIERPVGDGLFIYSSANNGPAAMLVYRPSAIRALPNVTVTLRGTLTDAGGDIRSTIRSRSRRADHAVAAGRYGRRPAVRRARRAYHGPRRDTRR